MKVSATICLSAEWASARHRSSVSVLDAGKVRCRTRPCGRWWNGTGLNSRLINAESSGLFCLYGYAESVDLRTSPNQRRPLQT